MSLFNPPKPPDPQATAAAQEQLNKQTAIYQQETNNVNQTNPYGSLTYTQTGVNADGIPQFAATTKLNSAEQALFDATVGTQNTIANDAGTLAKNLSGSLTNAPNLDPSAITNQLMKWQTDYMSPYFGQQTSNLNSQLANQGITQGSQAYNNAQRALNQSQSGSMENAMAADEGQAYQQMLQSYQAPIQTLGMLLGEGAPGSVSQNLVNTPQASIQPANYESLVGQNYQNQMSQYGNMMSGLFSIPSAVLGGWARNGFSLPSDRRLKRDITRVGWLNDGTPVYRYRYHDDPRMQIGVIAQDLVETNPDAVSTRPDGFMMVDYEKATSRAARAMQ